MTSAASPPSTARSRFQPSRRASSDHAEDQDRPDEVELLLDRERPEVLHRAGGVLGGEVVHGVAGQHPVDDVQRRGARLRRGVAPLRVGGEQPGERRASWSARAGRRAAAAGCGGPRRWPGRDRRTAACCIRCDVIRKPEMTKKTSTPTKPPVSALGRTGGRRRPARRRARAAPGCRCGPRSAAAPRPCRRRGCVRGVADAGAAGVQGGRAHPHDRTWAGTRRPGR